MEVCIRTPVKNFRISARGFPGPQNNKEVKLFVIHLDTLPKQNPMPTPCHVVKTIDLYQIFSISSVPHPSF